MRIATNNLYRYYRFLDSGRSPQIVAAVDSDAAKWSVDNCCPSPSDIKHRPPWCLERVLPCSTKRIIFLDITIQARLDTCRRTSHVISGRSQLSVPGSTKDVSQTDSKASWTLNRGKTSFKAGPSQVFFLLLSGKIRATFSSCWDWIASILLHSKRLRKISIESEEAFETDHFKNSIVHLCLKTWSKRNLLFHKQWQS